MLGNLLKLGCWLRDAGLPLDSLDEVWALAKAVWFADTTYEKVRAGVALALFLKPIIPGGMDDALLDALANLVDDDAVREFTEAVESALRGEVRAFAAGVQEFAAIL